VKLEVGRKYLSRDGRKITIDLFVEDKASGLSYYGSYYHKRCGSLHTQSFTEDGRFSLEAVNLPWDLVSVIEEDA
jgi:hypothetical protein